MKLRREDGTFTFKEEKGAIRATRQKVAFFLKKGVCPRTKREGVIGPIIWTPGEG